MLTSKNSFKKIIISLLGQLSAATIATELIVSLFNCNKNMLTFSFNVVMAGIFVLSYIFSVLEITCSLNVTPVFINLYRTITSSLGLGIWLFYLFNSYDVLSLVFNLIVVLVFATSCIVFLVIALSQLITGGVKNNVA